MMINNKWKDVVSQEFQKEYYKHLLQFLEEEEKQYTIYPQQNEIFKALELTDFDKVKVVILGQDPYHNFNQAHGLCFSVRNGIKIPPSLKNIYREIENDLSIKMSHQGDLTTWGLQGVLLLNTILTVRHGHANSHKNRGWEEFTDCIITALNNRKEPIIFLLWGNHAKSKIGLISNKNHKILTAAHPSPLSAHLGFFGCKHFSLVNELLSSMNEKHIKWEI